MSWMTFIDVAVTMAGVALIAAILDLRARTKTVPSAEERERWRQTQTKGYCHFVLHRGIVGCGLPIALIIGVLSMGAALLAGEERKVRTFAEITSPAPNATRVQADGKSLDWSQLGVGLGFVMIPSVLIGAYCGDRLWQMRKAWTHEEPKDPIDHRDQI